MDILKIMPYVMNIFSGVVLALCTYHIGQLRKIKEEEDAKQKALADGVEALLRESIVSSYNKYAEAGYAPIYAKESIKRSYACYHTLGGNDVATELYHKILEMPEKRGTT